MDDEDRPSLDELEAKYGRMDLDSEFEDDDEFDSEPQSSADAEEARAFAKADAVDAMGLARNWGRSSRKGPCVEIASYEPGLFQSQHQQRLLQIERENWSADVCDAYYEAFVLDLAAGNVALIQALGSNAERVTGTYPLGKTWQMTGRLDSKWRSRSRWTGFRRWFQGKP
jgi:hypothetical protein